MTLTGTHPTVNGHTAVDEQLVGGVRVRRDGDRLVWVPDVFELTATELRALARTIAGRVSARLSDLVHSAGALVGDAEKVRAATETRRALTVVDEDRVTGGLRPLTPECGEAVFVGVMDRLFALADLSPWWRNEQVENIDVNGHRQAIVTFAGGVKVWIGPIADNPDDLIDIVRTAARRLGLTEQGFDARTPYIDVHLPDGSRLAATFGGDRQSGVGVDCYVNIRRHRYATLSSDDLVNLGLLPDRANRFLRAWVRAGGNLIVAGDFNAGKTTALRAWAADIQPWHRVVTVESGITELGLHDQHGDRTRVNVVALYSRGPNSEGEGEVTVADLITRPVRRLNATRVIAGEINNGDEVIPILDCMTASTRGSMFTIHARSARGVVDRLESYGLMASPAKDPRLVRSMVIEAAPLIVHLTADETIDGRIVRYVTGIVEVVGRDRDGTHETVLMTDLWHLDHHNQLQPVARPSTLACENLARHGWVWATDGWSPA